METTKDKFITDTDTDSSRTLPPLTLLERLFLRFIRNFRGGTLRIHFPSGNSALVGEHSFPLHEMRVKDARFFKKVFGGGSVGFGEAYVEGLWDTPDLSALLTLMARNQRELGLLGRGFSLIARTMNQLYHKARRNTLEKSRENIQEHYDLSNAFYSHFLDLTMSYSSAFFNGQPVDLEQAQRAKIDRLLDLSGLQPGQHLLEIGSGWGALALRAAERGYRVTTITLSEAQYAYACELFERRGVRERIDIQLLDYRQLSGSYDAIVSCEMIEAVGKEYLDSYFSTLGTVLRPGGRAVLQAITIPDERYERYSRSCDWIQKHIFPGGHLPSPQVIGEKAGTAGRLKVERSENFGLDYAKTLRHWAARFNSRTSEIAKLGFSEAFVRKWNYYFSYCEAGFTAGLIDVQHWILTPDVAPLSRDTQCVRVV